MTFALRFHDLPPRALSAIPFQRRAPLRGVLGSPIAPRRARIGLWTALAGIVVALGLLWTASGPGASPPKIHFVRVMIG